ncbi:MAG: hypothetical protein KDC87_01070 [Planctomycetes bacterium]|nr:hypothetical protein [Planctomycetota bacterium]MCB9868824.1 hypothetical protein [Planctomycetota bacterium]
MQSQLSTVILASLALACSTVGQTKYASSPAGSEYQPGNTNNTYPFYGASSTYQQIHDAVDMAALNGRQPMVLNGMEFRPAATFNIPARSWNAQITLGVTTQTAATMSTTYASNFTSTPTIVLPYTNLSGAAGKGVGSTVPNAWLWRFPFTTIFPYVAAQGNLCWEWRHNNATATVTPLDAMSSSYAGSPTVTSNFGTGCTATGRSSPASASLTIAGGNITAALKDGASSAAAFLAIGLVRSNTSIGWCAPLYTAPAILVGGSTDAAGAWTAGTAPTSVLTAPSYAEIYTQYAFADAGLSSGIGLSDLAGVGTAANGGLYCARLYTINTSGNGGETATTGTKTSQYGLVTGFTTL